MQVKTVPVQDARITITRILKSNTINTHLEADFNQKLQTFFMTSRRLTEAFGIKSEDDFKQRLPLSVEVKIQGNKITEIKKIYSYVYFSRKGT